LEFAAGAGRAGSPWSLRAWSPSGKFVGQFRGVIRVRPGITATSLTQGTGMPRVMKLGDIVGAVRLSLLYAKPAAGVVGAHNPHETIAACCALL
jgi:hypothetical protein